jgi:hypothetical protein
MEWLRTVLQDGPVVQTEVEERAKRAGITVKPLKVAKQKLKVQSTRKGRGYWAWQLPFKKTKDVDGR